MAITTVTRKGQIKRKVDANTVQILHPETNADLVLYDNSTSGLTATNVQAAIDELTAGNIDSISINGNPQPVVNKDVNLVVEGNYNSSTNKIATESTVSDAIDDLDVSDLVQHNASTNPMWGKTLLTLSETDGKISATFQEIKIDSAHITDKTNSYSSAGTVVVTGQAVADALGTLDTSDVTLVEASDSGEDEVVTFKKLDETDGVVSAGSAITGIAVYTDAATRARLDKKVDKRTLGNEVYTHSDGTQGGIAYTTAATANTIVQRDAAGQIIVPETPTADNHAASKKYVDNKVTSGAEYLGTVSGATGSDSPQVKFSDAGIGDWCRATASFTYYDASTEESTTVHVGDILINTSATVSASTWDIIHTEVDTDTNTTYRAFVGAGSSTTGDVYAGSIKLQYHNLGENNDTWHDQDTIKFAEGAGITITLDTTNKDKLTIGHSNSTTARTGSADVYKINIDAQGHITSSDVANPSDIGVSLETYGATGHTAASDRDRIEVVEGSTTHIVNAVTTDTTQTISAAKTFSGNNTYSGTSSFTGATTVSGTLTASNNVTLGGSGKSVTFADGTSILPGANNSIDIGSSSSGYFKDIYASGSLKYAANKEKVIADIVTGPSSATDTAIAIYDGTSGKVIKNSSLTVGNSKITGGTGYVDLGSDLKFGASNDGYIQLDTTNDALIADGTGIKNLGTASKKWTTLYLTNLSDGSTSDTVTNILAGQTSSVYSGKKYVSGSWVDIVGTKSGKIITLGESGVITDSSNAKSFSAVQVNRQGIVIGGGQSLGYVYSGETSHVVNGGWYFEDIETRPEPAQQGA